MTPTAVFSQASRFAAACAEPTRMAIIMVLSGGEKNVSQIAQLTSVEMVNASHHLGVLQAAGIVTNRREGRFMMYKLTQVDVTKNGVVITSADGVASFTLNPSTAGKK